MSTDSDNQKEHEYALEVVRRLAESLEKISSEPTTPTPAPTTAAEFREVLRRVYDAGLRFNDMGQVSPLEDASGDKDAVDRTIRDLATQYPFFPREVNHLVRAFLVGQVPDAAVVGESGEVEGKLAALEEYVITPELRERYFLRRASKAPVLEDIDWEVGIKTAERGWSGAVGISYAEIALTLTHYLHPDNKSTVVNACIGEDMLVSLIDELSQALDALQRAKRIAERLPLHSKQEDVE